MVFINEWLPNPNGADAKGEFIEIFNNGSVPVNLNGWVLKTTAKKPFIFGAQIIAAHGYLVLTHATTKLSLKNNGETVSLYDAGGRLVDESSYLDAAPSGQSFSRVYYPASGSNGNGTSGVGGIGGANPVAQPQSFAWEMPTPGAANKVDLRNNISAASYPFGVPLNPNSMSGGALLAAIIFPGAILAALVVYFVKSDENISKLFFGRDN
jgi:hypothetical protein